MFDLSRSTAPSSRASGSPVVTTSSGSGSATMAALISGSMAVPFGLVSFTEFCGLVPRFRDSRPKRVFDRGSADFSLESELVVFEVSSYRFLLMLSAAPARLGETRMTAQSGTRRTGAVCWGNCA